MSETLEHCDLTAVGAAHAMAVGEMTAQELVGSCLERIAELEPDVQAWEFIDAEYAMEQAREADARHQSGRQVGALNGVPVGIKDIIDTRDMPTCLGTPIHAQRSPGHDATVVSRLREAGAIIMGKTVTTELAVYSPGKTTNPHNPAHTPGGSSSGSAAAVAAGMVPLAVGTQTNGSVIRPAAYCGVYGFKPSFGVVPRSGVMRQSSTLDHIGFFGSTLEDIALIGETSAGYDPMDSATKPCARPRLLQALGEELPMRPLLGFVRTPAWAEADADTGDAFGELCDALGEQVSEVMLPAEFDRIYALHQTIMEADLAYSFSREYKHCGDQLSDVLTAMIERGLQCNAVNYQSALAEIASLRRSLETFFYDYDALLTPATTGEAPVGLASTGSPVFCTIWTSCGVPAITLPLLEGSHDLPMGVQMVTRFGDDARLMRYARWLEQTLSAA
jgi:Asp-tRNA(Asn)/Glu-tRNA(Gln) amidotransferase A subunit family amidase